MLLLGGILESLAQPWCGNLFCRGGRPEIVPLCCSDGFDAPLRELWEPFVDNPEGPGDGPRCPAPGATGPAVQLLFAPLPPAFDPRGARASELFACVRLGPDGTVAAARLAGSTGRRSTDAYLLALMRSRWQFTEPDGDARGAWQRVRLSGEPRAILGG
jgi:hypothetical protein